MRAGEDRTRCHALVHIADGIQHPHMVRHRQCGQQRQPHRRTDRRAVERHQWWLRRVTGGQHMGGAEGRLDVGLLDGHRRQCDRLVDSRQYSARAASDLNPD